MILKKNPLKIIILILITSFILINHQFTNAEEEQGLILIPNTSELANAITIGQDDFRGSYDYGVKVSKENLKEIIINKLIEEDPNSTFEVDIESAKKISYDCVENILGENDDIEFDEFFDQYRDRLVLCVNFAVVSFQINFEFTKVSETNEELQESITKLETLQNRTLEINSNMTATLNKSNEQLSSIEERSQKADEILNDIKGLTENANNTLGNTTDTLNLIKKESSDNFDNSLNFTLILGGIGILIGVISLAVAIIERTSRNS